MRGLVHGKSTALLLLVQVAALRLMAGDPGKVDASFDPGNGIGTYSHANVRCFAEQSDGKLLFGGYFQTYDGFFQPCLGRAFPNGTFDSTFRPGLDFIVECITLQGDGKILIGGDFSNVSGTPRRRIARLNADGTLDSSFNPGSGANSTVASIIFQQDGRIVVGGAFTNFNGTACRGLVRLKADGSIDPSFAVSVEPLSWLGHAGVGSIVVQPDGKMVVAGTFNTVNGVARTNLVRLHPDGSIDTDFDPGRGPAVYPRTLAVQADGRLVIANSYYSIIRLNCDGSPDATFNAGRGQLGLQPWVDALAVQHDGKIVVVGYFAEIDGFPRKRLARLNADGTFDWSFHPGAGAENPEINGVSVLGVHVLGDDRLLIGGTFATIHGEPRRGIARLFGGSMAPNPPSIVEQPVGQMLRRYQPIELRVDGSSFQTPGIEWRRNGVSIPGATNRIFQVEFAQPNDAGDYTVVLRNAAGAVTSAVAVVTVDPVDSGPGALDVSYFPDVGGEVHKVAVDSNDRALVATDWELRRWTIDGTPDPEFDIGGSIIGPDGTHVYVVAIRPDGKLAVGGFFITFGGQERNYVTRLEPNGAADVAFVPQPGPDHSVFDIALDAEGKAVIVGSFWRVDGKERRCVARLKADGSLDESFNIGTGANYSVRAVVRQQDGKFIIGGGFIEFNGVPSGHIARLNTDGSLDTSFMPGGGANGAITSLALQPDGKIVVGGTFANFAGAERLGVARLNENGSLDPSFSSPFKISAESTALQPDGKVIVGGSFAVGTAPLRLNVVRLNADGSVDDSFAHGIWTDGPVYTVGLQSDGRILIGGSFNVVNGYPRPGLARLLGDQPSQPEPLRIRHSMRSASGAIQLQFAFTPGASCSVITSTDLANWDLAGVAREIAPGRFEFTDADAPNFSSRFYRVRTE